jgi:hypothetical protein
VLNKVMPVQKKPLIKSLSKPKKPQKAKRWLSATALTFAANLFPDFFRKKVGRKRL